jgi:hypothetical protein
VSVLLCVARISTAQTIGPQAGPSYGACVYPNTEFANFYRRYFARIASGSTDEAAAERTDLQLPHVLDSAVKVVADTTICRTAFVAYDAAVGKKLRPTGVAVIQIGPTWMVIKDLNDTEMILFNKTFSVVLARMIFQ